MAYFRSINGHLIFSSARKKPEVAFSGNVNGTHVFYLEAKVDAMFITIQLPQGNVITNPDGTTSNVDVSVRFNNALTNDGQNDDTEPVAVFTFDQYQNTQLQKSDIVLTIPPFIKVEIQTTADIPVVIYKDLM